MARAMENTVEAEAFNGSDQHLGRPTRLFWLYVGASSSWLSWLGPNMINRRYRHDPQLRRQAMAAYRSGINKGLLFSIIGLLAILAVPALIGLAAAHFAVGGNPAQTTGFGFSPSQVTSGPTQATVAQSQPTAPSQTTPTVSYDSSGYPIWQGHTVVPNGNEVWTRLDFPNCSTRVNFAQAAPMGYGGCAQQIGAYALTVNGQSVSPASVSDYYWPASSQISITMLETEFGPDPGDGSSAPVTGWGIYQVTGTTDANGNLPASTTSDLVTILPKQ